ncbi:hypothetical protein [Arthrobacter polaris]|uniref:hypothetical protein n=1 Tax=Arthrobacter polaris TaxID=2813727 RepID=UPI001F26D2DA|nr:hypothetical protein [Arthrobacter polaris]UIK88983.1 hypothetical protein J0916_00220 [Arthrobacter polaris]
MSTESTVQHLSSGHLGRRVTVKTKHTEALGVLKGFEHDSSIIANLTYAGTDYVPGATTTHVTTFPDQRALAGMGTS